MCASKPKSLTILAAADDHVEADENATPNLPAMAEVSNQRICTEQNLALKDVLAGRDIIVSRFESHVNLHTEECASRNAHRAAS